MFGFKRVKKEIKVQGMHCGHCASRVENALKSIDGVKSVKIDLSSGAVTILSSAVLDDEKIKAAVAQAGFEVV